jgi:hypothetical protein
MTWPAVKKSFKQEQFRSYVEALAPSRWRPSLIVWHNTAAPTLAQWHETAGKDVAAGRVPGSSRIDSLESYFRNDRGWSGCPHLFVADDLIWAMNPLTAPGVHSPSWNSISIGIEMVADFDREDDDSGAGLMVRQNTVFATAVLCSAFGLDPHVAIKLHKEDPKTTHACPGEDFARDKAAAIAEVIALMDGGEHHHDDTAAAIGVLPAAAKPTERHGVVATDGLNVRRGPGVLNESIGSLPKGLELVILDEARNATTAWLNVRTPAGYTGWVSGHYVTIGGSNP